MKKLCVKTIILTLVRLLVLLYEFTNILTKSLFVILFIPNSHFEI